MNQSVTVSYGSFSLTVEGYDDPYKIIREITELYGKMSAVYPNFGAEPMQTEVKNSEHEAEKKYVEPLPVNKNTAPHVVSQNEKIAHNEDSGAEILELEETIELEPAIDPLVLEEPLPKYRRIDLSQIRAAAHPLSASELRGADPKVKKFPANGEH